MSDVYLIESSNLTNIANVIRSKIGTSSTMTPDNMAFLISNNIKCDTDVPPRKYQKSTITSYYGNETVILSQAFYSCPSLTSVSFPRCTYIDNYAFAYCDALTTVSFPVCEIVGNDAFNSCKSLTTVSFSRCTNIYTNAFTSCTALTTVSLPVCSYIGGMAFQSCTALTTVYIPVCEWIGPQVFMSCYSLSAIYLNQVRSVPYLKNSNAFLFTNGSFKIYVPKSLYNSFLTATNWSNYSSRLVSV